MFDHLKKLSYRCILADPPWLWKAYSNKGLRKSAQSHYSCMSLDAIKQMPVGSLAHPDGAVCLMWATAPMIQQALDTMKAWDFTFKTMAAWAKQSSTGAKWSFGTGYIFRSAAEFLIVGTRGKPIQKVRNVRNLIVAPVREHSRKPDVIYDLVESLWNGPYLELFARQQREGWDCFGDQTDKYFPLTEAAPHEHHPDQ